MHPTAAQSYKRKLHANSFLCLYQTEEQLLEHVIDLLFNVTISLEQCRGEWHNRISDYVQSTINKRMLHRAD